MTRQQAVEQAVRSKLSKRDMQWLLFLCRPGEVLIYGDDAAFVRRKRHAIAVEFSTLIHDQAYRARKDEG